MTEILRQQTETCIVRVNARRGSKLHYPDDSEDEVPICESKDVSGGDDWQEKSLAVYPPGYKSWCERCLRIMEVDE